MLAGAQSRPRVESIQDLVRGIGAADVGIFFLRTILGIIFLGHGLQKLGWFEGGGYPTSITEQEQFLAALGYDSTEFLAWVLTLSEIGAGISLVFGFLTPLGAAAVMGIMFQFVAGLQWHAGLFGNATEGGFEFSLVGMGGALALAFIGGGAISADGLFQAFSRIEVPRFWVGLIAIALGLLVGLIVLETWGVGLAATPEAFAAPA